MSYLFINIIGVRYGAVRVSRFPARARARAHACVRAPKGEIEVLTNFRGHTVEFLAIRAFVALDGTMSAAQVRPKHRNTTRSNKWKIIRPFERQNPCLQCNSLNDSRRPINP